MKHLLLPNVLFLLAIFLTGCGDDLCTVDGTVTFEGQPVAQAAILFVGGDNQSIREGAVVQDGRFQIRLKPGRYRIELTGQKVVGKRTQKGFDGQLEEINITRELFPAKYNEKSELSEEFTAGRRTLSLDLK